MPHIFDGYNLLRTIQKTDDSFHDLDEVALARILAEYLKYIRDHGHLVFDGTGPPDKTDFDRLAHLRNLEVYFSGPNSDADTVIERKIADNSAPNSLTIVSTDRRLRDAAAKRKAISIRSDIFWITLLKRLENRKRPTNEPREKRQGITESETDQWLDLFGLNQ